MATPEDGLKAAQEATQSLLDALHDEGITLSYLAKKLHRELNAKENKVFCTKEGQVVVGPAMVAWDVRQKARIDAHRLLDNYPAEKHEHSGAGRGPIVIELVDYGKKDESTE